MPHVFGKEKQVSIANFKCKFAWSVYKMWQKKLPPKVFCGFVGICLDFLGMGMRAFEHAMIISALQWCQLVITSWHHCKADNCTLSSVYYKHFINGYALYSVIILSLILTKLYVDQISSYLFFIFHYLVPAKFKHELHCNKNVR